MPSGERKELEIMKSISTQGLGSFASKMPTTWEQMLDRLILILAARSISRCSREERAREKARFVDRGKWSKVSIPRKKNLFPCSRGRPHRGISLIGRKRRASIHCDSVPWCGSYTLS